MILCIYDHTAFCTLQNRTHTIHNAPISCIWKKFSNIIKKTNSNCLQFLTADLNCLHPTQSIYSLAGQQRFESCVIRKTAPQFSGKRRLEASFCAFDLSDSRQRKRETFTPLLFACELTAKEGRDFLYDIIYKIVFILRDTLRQVKDRSPLWCDTIEGIRYWWKLYCGAEQMLKSFNWRKLPGHFFFLTKYTF